MKIFLPKKSILLTLLLLFSLATILPQVSEGFKKNKTERAQGITARSIHTVGLALELTLPNNTNVQEDIVAPFDAFPNLHMLVVHFPVVLLVVALLFQTLSFFIYKEGMDITTLIILGLGWLGAILATYVFHPHVADLPEQTQKVFEAHEFYAFWTVGLSSAALALKAVTFFFFRDKRWMEWLTLLVMAATIYAVANAGHLGSQLVYIEGVGPQGQYIEQQHGSENQH